MKALKGVGIDFGRSRIEPLFHSIFFPTLLSMVFASFFTVADGIFVGQGVGSNALAAINIVSPLFLMTTGIALMFGVGASVVASIHLSQGNNKAADINITQAFEVATLLMVIVAVLVYFYRFDLWPIGNSDSVFWSQTSCRPFPACRYPTFVLMPMLISPQGMWLAVPVTECLTLLVILLTK